MVLSKRLALVVLSFGLAAPAMAAEDWHQQVANGLGKLGSEMPGGVYRVSLPRTDLKVALDGVELKPAFALGSWLAFKKVGDHVVVMGDLVLTDTEINPVMKHLVANGIGITAIHNHLLRASPNTMYMHVHGHGDPGQLAATFREALAASKTAISGAAAGNPAAEEKIDLDTTAIDRTLGRSGKISGGVYQVSIPRAEAITDGGMEVPEPMGSAIAINFQPTGGGKAAITGDFVLTAEEVNPVLRTLRENGIEVTALHNHMLGDQPRLFFMHFWANNEASKLANGLAAALDKVKIARS